METAPSGPPLDRIAALTLQTDRRLLYRIAALAPPAP